MKSSFDEDFGDQLWTVYDNATDSAIASGSRKEVYEVLGMKAAAFDAICDRYKKGERLFEINGVKTSINIMIDGFNLSRGA